MNIQKIDKQLLRLAGIIVLLTALLIFGLRFALLKKLEVHYHANFAVFIDGERLPFDKFTFYEEIESCGGNGLESPKIRAHMHDQIDHVVHVHDNGATWGHFFSNLGFVLGNEIIQTDEGTFTDDDDSTLTFVLNNDNVDSIYNRTISSEDVLLISYGSDDAQLLQEQYSQIEQDAAEYNEKDDPSACSGGKPFTFTERIKQTFQIWE